MYDKLGSDFADGDGSNFIDIDFSFDGGVFEVVDSEIGDEDIPFLFLFVVIEFEDGAAEDDILSVLELFHNGLIGSTV